MIQKDTVRLLRECDAGAKMGISSIDDVLQYAKGKEMKTPTHSTQRGLLAYLSLFKKNKKKD